MSEEDEEDGEPAVALGTRNAVDGAPVARIAERLSWPQERSAIVAKVGDERVRTPEGGRALADLLEETEITYFASRNEFLSSIRDVMGEGPIPTEE